MFKHHISLNFILRREYWKQGNSPFYFISCCANFFRRRPFWLYKANLNFLIFVERIFAVGSKWLELDKNKFFIFRLQSEGSGVGSCGAKFNNKAINTTRKSAMKTKFSANSWAKFCHLPGTRTNREREFIYFFSYLRFYFSFYHASIFRCQTCVCVNFTLRHANKLLSAETQVIWTRKKKQWHSALRRLHEIFIIWDFLRRLSNRLCFFNEWPNSKYKEQQKLVRFVSANKRRQRVSSGRKRKR